MYFFIITRYFRGSTKEMERTTRGKGMTKIFNLKLTTPLPTQKQLFTVTANKTQLIEFIVEELITSKDDYTRHTLVLTGPDPVPVEIYDGVVTQKTSLETHQEETDVMVIHQVIVL